ncbi:flavonol sulfotransferase-like, partial [Quercus suber]
YEGFWCGPYSLEGILLMAQDHFKPQPNQVILSSTPKSSTTWLEAPSFAIITRSSCDESTNPLLTKMAHDLVPFLEFIVGSNVQTLDLDVPLVAEEILATHIPYTSLPKSIINSCYKIVYICSDPKDVFVSQWHFAHKLSATTAKASAREDLHLEDAFEFFCGGLSPYGPYWDHLLGYWRASLESPEKILFLKCEDLKAKWPNIRKKKKKQREKLREEVGSVVYAKKEREIGRVTWRRRLWSLLISPILLRRGTEGSGSEQRSEQREGGLRSENLRCGFQLSVRL